jgi:glycosyltransferase involved in cell wall biosynthesis
LNGVQVTRVRHFIPKRPSNYRRFIYEVAFGLRAALAGWGHPDVIISTSPALLSTAVARVRKALTHRRTPFGIIVQDLYSRGLVQTLGHQSLPAKILALLESRTLGHAESVVVIHDRFQQAVLSSLGLASQRVSVIRNWSHINPPVDFDRESARAQFGWGPETVILHAGNMGMKQGLENVVEAARYACDHSIAVRFVLLGDGNQRSHLERLGVGVGNLQFISPLPDHEFTQALGAADLLLVNERAEMNDSAVPSKLTSYFAAGRPVIAAVPLAGVVAAELSASGAGLSVPPGEPASLVKMAMQMAGEPDLRLQMGSNALAFADEHLTRRSAIRRYEEWVTSLHRTAGASSSNAYN